MKYIGRCDIQCMYMGDNGRSTHQCDYFRVAQQVQIVLRQRPAHEGSDHRHPGRGPAAAAAAAATVVVLGEQRGGPDAPEGGHVADARDQVAEAVQRNLAWHGTT